MKKLIAAILCAGLMAAAFSGCAYKDALDDHGSSATSSVQASDASNSDSSTDNQSMDGDVQASDYEDSLDGLESYFAKLGYLNTDSDGKVKDDSVVKMDSSLIGASAGKKYATTYDGSQITIELYSYDSSKLNDTANQVIDSVKNDGSFSILNLPEVNAYLSDNGKYLMIYNDTKIDDEDPDKTSNSYKHREEVVSNFTAFHNS